MKRFLLLVVGFSFCSAPVFAQNTTTSTTTAACSPVINGGSAQVSINCNGVSAAKIRELTTLMNRIVAEHLDVSAINGKLDQLQADMSGLKQQMGGLQAALSPLSNAPPAVIALAQEFDLARSKCLNLMSDWTERTMQLQQTRTTATAPGPTTADRDAALAANRARVAANSQRRADMLAAKNALDAEEQAKYAESVRPRLEAVRTKLAAAVPDYATGKSYESVASGSALLNVCMDFYSLGAAYQQKVMHDLTLPGATRPK